VNLTELEQLLASLPCRPGPSDRDGSPGT
jgi:hypothetical protein